MFTMRRLIIIGLALAAAAMPVLAVDGAFGRSIPGTWVVPSAGVVGPEAGFSFTTFPIGYMGARGGNRLSEVAGVILTNDEADVSINVLIPSTFTRRSIRR
jgi:hypothetical protein